VSGLFNPKVPAPLPVINPADTQNRINDALGRMLQAGGTNADTTSTATAPVGGARMPTLTGLN
jgi:hypothetical protein